MTKETIDYINKLANRVIEVYNIGIPITDIKEVTERIGGKVKEQQIFDAVYDGTIKKTGPKTFEIMINENQSEERKTFTVAHELGHLFLHMGYRTNKKVWEKQKTEYRRFGRTEQENQANEFATALLMPRDEYKKVLDKNTTNSLVNIKVVAEHFKVSIPAAVKRGISLGYIEN